MKKRFLIFLMTAALLCGAVALALYEIPQKPVSVENAFSFTLKNQGHSETISCFRSEGERLLYVFLPSYADLSQLEVHLNTHEEIYAEDVLLTDKTRCDSFQLDTPYKLTFPDRNQKKPFQLEFVRSGGVPALYIQTESGSMDAIHEDADYREPGTLTLFNADGTLDYSGTLDSIGGRGFSSWANPKRPYNITLSNRGNLLGMGSAWKWVLIANAYDKTNLRDKIVYDTAAQMGLAGSPACEFVDLYLNGEYAGLYLLSERVEIDSERVDITNPGGDITGGYLFELQLPIRINITENAFTTQAGQLIKTRDPMCNEAQLAYLSQQVQQLENAILARDGVDPVSGKNWLELIDLDSWVKKYLIEEAFENMDAGAASQYFYKDADSVDSRFYAGPVWDYDYAIGNGDASALNPRCFLANRWWKKADNYTPWYAALYEKPEFYQRVTELFQQELLPILNDLTETRINTMATEIAPASEMNRLRWLSQYEETQVAERTEYMRNFLAQRTDFLVSAWVDGVDYCTICINEGDNTEYLYYAVERDSLFEELPAPPNAAGYNFLGWYLEDTDQLFDPSQPITENLTICAHWEPLADQVEIETQISTESEVTASQTPSQRLKALLPLVSIFTGGGLFVILVAVDFGRTRQNRRKSP